MTGLMPTITSHRALMPERFWIPVQTFAADGGTRPKLRGRSVSSALSCISFHIRAEGTAGTFQRGKSPDQLQSGNVSFKSSAASSRTHSHAISQHTASLDILAEPNYYNKSAQTSSTRYFASQCRESRNGVRSNPRKRVKAAPRSTVTPNRSRESRVAARTDPC